MANRRKGRHGDGTVYRRPGSPYWWVKFPVNGRPVYESTRTKDKPEAKRYLRRRLGEVATRQFVSLKSGRLTISELCQLVVQDYEDNQYRSLPDLLRHLRHHVEPMIGTVRAIDFGTRHVKRYFAQRQVEGASPATVNRELNIVRRGYNLAHRHDPPLVARVPYIETLAENNVRRGIR